MILFLDNNKRNIKFNLFKIINFQIVIFDIFYYKKYY
jgi:hypothetical protein